VLSLDDVRRAAARIAPHLPRTPLRRSFAAPGSSTFLKLECWQPTGSFKVRGAVHHLLALTPQDAERGIIAASAGNHALGVAWAAQALGGRVKATLVVPASAPRSKLEKLRSFPVTVIESGSNYDEAYAESVRIAEATGQRYVHAYDDPLTAAGQGTAVLEIFEDLPDVGAILVPVGGGGLISAMAAAAKELAPDVRIVAVQPEVSPSLRESIRLGVSLHDYPTGDSLADGIAGGIGDLVFEHRGQIDEIVEVSEGDIEDAIVALIAQDQVVAEASGAVGIAALRSGRFRARDGRPVVAVITGANIDASVLARLLPPRV
jgi:threonine dehydratase